MSHYKPYPAYKESGVEWFGQIPEHWMTAQLRRVIDAIEQGWSPECFAWPAADGEWGVLKAGCVNNGEYREWENKALPAHLAARPEYEVIPGDVLMSRASGSPELVGSVALVSETRPKLMLSDKVFRIRLQRIVKPNFFVAAVGSRPLRFQIENELSGGNGLANNLSQAALMAFVAPLPPLPEQRSISAVLDRETARIDALIAKKTRFIELLKEKRQALITHAVTKGLDPRAKMKDSDVEWIGQVPEHWRVERLAALYREAIRPGDEALPVLSISIHDGISDDELSPDERDRQVYQIEDRTKYKRVRPNDLAYNMMRAWQGAFGAVQVDGLVSPAYVVAEPQDDTRSAYIEQLLRTPMAVEEMRRFSRGIADFRMRLYWEYFRDLKVCVPSASEQDRILSALEKSTTRIDMLTAKTEHSIALLKERRSALVTAAVTGKIDLRSPTESTP